MNFLQALEALAPPKTNLSSLAPAGESKQKHVNTLTPACASKQSSLAPSGDSKQKLVNN